MFKNILLPTDGSPLAAKGFKAGVRLAASLGARVTGVFVIPPYTPPVYGEGMAFAYQALSPRDYQRDQEKVAARALAAIEKAAQAAGVRCSTRSITAPYPHDGILKAARAAKCDAIAMATHGRGGLGGLLLGSETQRVLAHAKIPVIVVR